MRRRWLPLTLVAVASITAFLALFALWANRQLLDTDNWVDTSSQLLENDEIRGELSVFLVDRLYANVDVQAKLEEALPPRAAPLAGTVAGALRQVAERGVNALLQRPRAQALWEGINRRAHTRFLEILDGGGDVASTEDGVLVLDLRELLLAVQERVGIGGRAAEALPEDAAKLTIIDSDTLELAQDLVDVLKAVAVILILLMLGLFSLAVYLARGWRREALRACGFGLIAAGGVALVARSFAGDAVVDALVKTDSVIPAAEAAWSIGTSLLSEAATASLAYGIVIVLAAWLSGATSVAVSARTKLAPWLSDPAYAYGALSAIVLVLVAWGPTPAFRKPILALLLVGFMALGMEALRRQTAREHPGATHQQSAAPSG